MNTQQVKTESEMDRALRVFRDAVPQRAAYEFELTALDRLGICLWAAFVWAEDGDFSDGFGYGSGPTGARVSAWGEVVENYFATRSLTAMPRRRGSFTEMLKEGAIDPISLCLNAGVEYEERKTIVWTNGVRFVDRQPVWLPIEAAAIAPSDIAEDVPASDLLFTPITNGLGAGTSLEQALAHGVLELVQRDGDSVTFRAMDEGVRIELDDVQDAGVRELLRLLDEQGIEVIAKLAGVVCGIPVIYVVGHDRDLSESLFHLSLSACGEAAHPNREIALAKALREFVSSRARKRFMHGPLADMRAVAPPAYVDRVLGDPLGDDESRALRSVLDWIAMSPDDFFEAIRSPIFETRTSVPFSSLPTVDAAEVDTAEGLMRLLESRLAAEGFEVLFVDFTPPSANGFAVVKAIVPDLEVETMSYYRIGRRNFDRLRARGSRDPRFADLVGTGDAPAGARRIHLSENDRALLGGDAWLDPAAVDRAVGPLYALYREPNGHTAGKVLAAQAS